MSNNEQGEFIEDDQLSVPHWEEKFNKILTPFEQFVNKTTTGGLLLMAAACVALIFANSPLASLYDAMLHTHFGLYIAELKIDKSLHHWVNDGLMALFFFIVGLELKREILVGELASVRKAMLPIVAAIGGMIVPALCYTALNYGSDSMSGWGIPMATDIAFALGVIALLASRVPKALITFLVALAIVDDLGAVVVIALFYTQELIWEYLLISALLTALLVGMNTVGIRKPSFYFAIGILLWLVLLKSGVHATLAGVITAFTIPAKPRFDPGKFSQRVAEILVQFNKGFKQDKSILKNQRLSALVQTLENGVLGVQTPLQRLEHSLHKPVAFLVLPIFAFFNAGVAIDISASGDVLSHSVTLGVMFGLLVGKFIGIVGFSWIALRLGLCSLPKNTHLQHIIGAAMLGSIGFTMSIFIAELAFVGQPQMITYAKLGILISSVLAGTLGYLWLRYVATDQSSKESDNKSDNDIDE